MNKIIILTTLLTIFVAGFLIPRITSDTLSADYELAVSTALEGKGILYPGVKMAESQDANDNCESDELTQVLINTSSWMYLPGPSIALCVYANDPQTVKSATAL